MSATNFIKPRTEAYQRLVQQIASLAQSTYEHTYQSVEKIVSFYNNYSCEQLAVTLLQFLKADDTNRCMVIQLKEHLRELESEVQA